jgi:hypothetical protein
MTTGVLIPKQESMYVKMHQSCSGVSDFGYALDNPLIDFYLLVEELYPELAGLYDMATRTYPLGVALPSHSDHINSPLGCAWVAWNSRVGVTQDVWAVISTA